MHSSIRRQIDENPVISTRVVNSPKGNENVTLYLIALGILVGDTCQEGKDGNGRKKEYILDDNEM